MIPENKIKILIVEDDEIDVRAFERTLKKAHISYTLSSCVYADEALELLNGKQANFDCIFLDYQLPGMDGLTLLKKIKSLGFEKPILVMTSQGDEKVAVEMMKAGAFDYFPKSDLSPSKITNTISSIFRLNSISDEKMRIEKTLKKHQQFTEAITKYSPNIIYVYDITTGKYVFVNRSIFKELGYNKAQIKEMGHRIFNFTLHPDHMEAVAEHLRKLTVSEDGVTHEVEYQIKNVQGQWVWYYNRDIVFRRDDQNKVLQVLGSTSNISKLKKVEEDLRLAKQEAENSTQVKAEFLSNMSHEIRTPMNAIIGLTDILLAEKHSAPVVENLKSIKHSADNLLVIINDILDFSKIEAGKMVIESIDFDFNYQLNHISSIMAPRAYEKGLKFELIVDQGIPKYLLGDPFRLNQIILNLAGNAIKFTKTGFVKIQAKLIADHPESIEMKISIKDSGIGISKDKQKTIFDSFTQATADTTRFFGGTGLGLTITTQLAKLMGGSVEVESELGVGSEFSLLLNFKKSGGIKISKEVDEVDEQSLAGLNILVVEDNVINQKVISQILKSWQCNYVVANNGREGLNELTGNTFDCVLMDLQMPVLNGYETAKLIREGAAGKSSKNIPIIALTADAFPETREKVISTGMNDFVSKPFKKAELNCKIFKLTNSQNI